MATTKNTSTIFLPSAAVRARYDDASDMWIDRRLKDDSGFPKPIYIAKRRFWRVTDLETWERGLATAERDNVKAA